MVICLSVRLVKSLHKPEQETGESNASTKALVWFMVALCVVAGAWEAGAVIGGLQMLGSGRRSTRAD